MRADATAWWCIADHDVVESPTWQEVEVFEQLRNFGYIVVHCLYQEGPVALGKFGENGFIEGAVANLPGAVGAMLLDQACLDSLFASQTGKLVWVQRAFNVGKSATDQQWLALPVITQELGGCQAAE